MCTVGIICIIFEFVNKTFLYHINIGESVCVCVCVSFRRYTRRRLWSDRDQIWHTHADSSPNGSGLNINQPRVTQGGLGVLGGQKIKNME